MSIMEFWSLRRAERRARKADRAMLAAFGQSWVVNRDGVYELLTTPTPLVVLDVGMLRGVVAEALAGATFSDEALPDERVPILTTDGEDSPVLRTDAEYELSEVTAAEVESPREDAIFEERNNGVEAVPVRQNMMYDDDRRRAFLRTFFQQGPVRGPVVPTR